MDLPSLLAQLSLQRPLFHSEADFQHALAWEIHTHYLDAKIRLEYRPARIDARMYVDLWVVLANGVTWALELKYKTRHLDIDLDGETYRLLNQSAQDQARYDFLRDAYRLEQLAAAHAGVIGAAVLLTNDSSYWTHPRSVSSADAAFRVHEGRTIAGPLAWGTVASAGTMQRRETPIPLSGNYQAAWAPYSVVRTDRNGIFKYLLFDVTVKNG
jgi:hypothetical protein